MTKLPLSHDEVVDRIEETFEVAEAAEMDDMDRWVRFLWAVEVEVTLFTAIEWRRSVSLVCRKTSPVRVRFACVFCSK